MQLKLVLLLQLVMATAMAQQVDSIHQLAPRTVADFQKDFYIGEPQVSYSNKIVWKRALKAPLILTALSLYSFTDNEAFDKHEVKEIRDRVSPSFRHHADNYLQYAPVAAVYGLNLAGIKGKNDFTNRTMLLTKSMLLVAAITYPLKTITAVPRPDTGQRNSFPSGHTATAFAAATFMAKEYGHINMWYSIGAYTAATGVGAMRILNNRHWITDTLAGAAVGILSTNIAYLTHQYKWGHHRKHNASQTIVVPAYDGQTGMVSIVHVLH